MQTKGKMWMVALCPLKNIECPQIEGFSQIIAFLGAVEDGQIVQSFGNMGMTGPKKLLADRQGALIERLGLHIFALRIVQNRQIIEAIGNVWVMRSQRLDADTQGAAIAGLGQVVLRLRVIKDC